MIYDNIKSHKKPGSQQFSVYVDKLLNASNKK